MTSDNALVINLGRPISEINFSTEESKLRRRNIFLSVGVELLLKLGANLIFAKVVLDR